ncbi:MAG: hypothetical protein R2848_19635 [Thermomicrobiales bacterium]
MRDHVGAPHFDLVLADMPQLSAGVLREPDSGRQRLLLEDVLHTGGVGEVDLNAFPVRFMHIVEQVVDPVVPVLDDNAGLSRFGEDKGIDARRDAKLRHAFLAPLLVAAPRVSRIEREIDVVPIIEPKEIARLDAALDLFVRFAMRSPAHQADIVGPENDVYYHRPELLAVGAAFLELFLDHHDRRVEIGQLLFCRYGCLLRGDARGLDRRSGKREEQAEHTSSTQQTSIAH